MSETPTPIVLLSVWIVIILSWSVFVYVKDIIMEKVNDYRMLREEIEEEKELLRTEIKDIENS